MNANRFSRFPMKKGEVFKLAQPSGCVIRAEKGRLWITQTHRADDFFIEAGGAFVARGNDALVAEAMEPALLSVTYMQTHTSRPAPALVATGAALQGA